MTQSDRHSWLEGHCRPAGMALATSLALASHALAASPVAITNPSFENSASGSTPVGWTNVNGGATVFIPTTTQYDPLTKIPDGANVASAFAGASGDGLSQVLSATLQADATYTLTVGVGDPADAAFDGYTIQLRANGTLLVQDDNTQTPADGDFATATATYVYNAGDAALVGQPLEIRLISKGLSAGDVNFDNVQLSVTLANPAADPGGPYSVPATGGSLSLDGSASQPSDGQSITAYDWDLDNDGDFDEAISGATPTAISSADLQSTYGMTVGANTIKLRVTDDSSPTPKTSTVEGTVTLTALPTPVAYWPMRDGLPGTTVPTTSGSVDDVIDDAGHPCTDATPNNINSTFEADPVRGIVWSTVEGNRLTAGQQGIDLNTQSGWTWALWAKISSSNLTDSGADVIMGSRNATWNKLDISGASNWINPTFGAAGNPANDTWQHIVFVGDATGGSIYVNGVFQNKDTSFNGGALSTAIYDDPMEIGGSSRFTEDITGLMSDVAVWDVALTPTQIADLANGANVIADVTAPYLAATTPVDDDTNASSSLIQVIFDEPVAIGSGDIRIVNDTDTVTTTLPVGDSQVVVSGASLTINLTTPLLVGKAYHIEMDAGVVTNVGGLPFAGISDSSTWNFVVDNTPPTVALVDDVGGGPIYEDLTLVNYTVTFNEPIDGTTVDASDFDNAGSATVSIGTITQTDLGVFNVAVLPTTTGTLQLRIPGGSVITDTSGNGLVVPVLDDTTINILSGSDPSGGTRYWDGPTTTGVTDGVSQGGSGTWDNGSTTSWDRGLNYANPVAWDNAHVDDAAVFGGTAGTVTVAGPISLGDLSFDLTGQYTIDGGTLNFAPGSTIRTADNRYWQTITSAITGSPAVETKDFGAGNQYKGFIFAPAGGTQTLGAILNPNNTGNTDKAGVTFAGSTSGNSAASVDYAVGDRYADTVLQSGEWSIPGGIRTGTVRVNGGVFTLGGTVQGDYNGYVANGGTVKGVFTILSTDRRSTVYMNSGSTIAPGNSIGTVTIDWTGTQGINAGENDYSLWMKDGAIYDWEVGAGNTTDTIHLVEGRLYVDAITLNVIDAGGAPTAGDQLPVFTYDAGVLVDLVGFNPANVVLPAGWTGTPSLVDNGIDTVYLTGISAPGGPSDPYSAWAATNAPTGTPEDDYDGDGVSNALELVLGGDKDTNDLDKLPSVAATPGGDMTLSFIRDQASIHASVAVTIEVSTDLVTWDTAPSPYAVPDTATAGPPVAVVDNLDGTDTVTLTVARAPDAKKFGRLKVVVTTP